MKTENFNEKGKKQPQISLIALSTCFFCNTVKKMLTNGGFKFTSTDLDLLPEAEREEQLAQIRQFNPEESFPIVIIDNIAIVGFQEERIKKELGIE